MRIKKGDTILIISGKDRGKKGKVLRVFPKELRLLAENVNLRKKHRRPRRGGEKGQIISIPASIPASNAMLVCPKCGKPTRIGTTVIEEKKYRMCKQCKSEF